MNTNTQPSGSVEPSAPQMKSYPNEGPDELAERKRIGLILTPYDLPRSDEEMRAIAQELLSRYVVPHGVNPLDFGADCIALGGMVATATLCARVAELEAQLAEALRARRFEIENTEKGIRICRGEHHRSADHEWENYVPESALASAEAALKKATEPGRRYEEWKEYMKLEGLLDNTATFCRRLAKALGSDHPISKATMQYLDENDLLQSPLRAMTAKPSPSPTSSGGRG